MFREHYHGLLDEDDLLDNLRLKVQLKNKTIDEYVDGFRQIVSRLKRPPPTPEKVKFAYKNLRRPDRDYFSGQTVDSFRKLLRLGRECKREMRIDERQSQLLGKRIEKLAEISEKTSEGHQEKKGKGSKNKKGEVREQSSGQMATVTANNAGPSGSYRQGGSKEQSNSKGDPTNQENRPKSQGPQGFRQGQMPIQSTASGKIREQTFRSAPKQSEMRPKEMDHNQYRCRKCNEPGHRMIECPTTKCYGCGEFSHIGAYCPTGPELPHVDRAEPVRKGPSQYDRYCYRCGLEGVIIRDCPNCNGPPLDSGNGSAGAQFRPVTPANQTTA